MKTSTKCSLLGIIFFLIVAQKSQAYDQRSSEALEKFISQIAQQFPCFAEIPLNIDLSTITELIEKNADPNIRANQTSSILLAAHVNDPNLIKLLVDHGANIEEIHGNLTALMWASIRGNTNAVIQLLNCGANINAEEFGARWTAVMYAANNDHLDTTLALLGYNAIINDMTLRVANYRISETIKIWIRK